MSSRWSDLAVDLVEERLALAAHGDELRLLGLDARARGLDLGFLRRDDVARFLDRLLGLAQLLHQALRLVAQVAHPVDDRLVLVLDRLQIGAALDQVVKAVGRQKH